MSMKLTLLEIVQDILDAMNSDQVSSISDTVESQQVARIVRGVFYEISGNRDWPHHRVLDQLSSVSDTSRKTHLQIPEIIRKVTSVRYNKRKSSDTRDKFEDVEYMHPDAFLRHTNSRNESESNVEYQTDASGVQIKVRTDISPQYWTSFDDEYIVMDNIDTGVDTTLQGSKTQILGYRDPTWTHEDTHTPDLPSEAFPGLVAEAKSTAFAHIKEVVSEKAEQQAQRQRRWLARKSGKVTHGVPRVSYGRKRGHALKRNPLLDKN